MPKKPFNTHLDTDLIQQLKIQAVKEGISASELIERLVKEYLKGEKTQ